MYKSIIDQAWLSLETCNHELIIMTNMQSQLI